MTTAETSSRRRIWLRRLRWFGLYWLIGPSLLFLIGVALRSALGV